MSKKCLYKLSLLVVAFVALFLYVLYAIGSIDLKLKFKFLVALLIFFGGAGVVNLIAAVHTKMRELFILSGILLGIFWIFAAIEFISNAPAFAVIVGFFAVILLISAFSVLARKGAPAFIADNDGDDYKDYKERQAEKEPQDAREKEQQSEIKIKTFKD